MRYYSLEIIQASSGNVIRNWTSHPNGIYAAPDPGALNVEFDLIIYPSSALSVGTVGGDFGASHIRVWGIPLSDIAQAQNWSTPYSAPTYTIKFAGGMGKGLPLADPNQAGTLVEASIYRSFGNWIGTEMTLDLFLMSLSPTGAVSAGSATVPANPGNNFTLNWPKNTPLAPALKACLQAAYPGVPVQISISPNLIVSRDQAHWAPTIGALADFINRRSVAMLGPGNPQYLGVQIAARSDGTIMAYDGSGGSDNNSTGGTTAPQFKTTDIAFTDLIGQPTWIGNGIIQVTTVLRADIHQGDKITLPPSLTTVSAQAALQSSPQFAGPRFSSQFQGTFTVQQVRAVGNYKSPQGIAWVTTIQAVSNQGPAVEQS